MGEPSGRGNFGHREVHGKVGASAAGAGFRVGDPRRERLAARPRLEELFGEFKDKEERDEQIYQAVRLYGYTLKQVAEVVGLSYYTVSVIAKKVAEAKESEK